MNDKVISVIRTAVPTAIGALAAWLLTKGIELDEATKSRLSVALTSIVGTAYYVAVRTIASRAPWVEWLLGYPAIPVYVVAPSPKDSDV